MKQEARKTRGDDRVPDPQIPGGPLRLQPGEVGEVGARVRVELVRGGVSGCRVHGGRRAAGRETRTGVCRLSATRRIRRKMGKRQPPWRQRSAASGFCSILTGRRTTRLKVYSSSHVAGAAPLPALAPLASSSRGRPTSSPQSPPSSCGVPMFVVRHRRSC